MQEAIKNYIEEERKNDMPFNDIEAVINKVARIEMKVARQKQLRLWRKEEKYERR